MIYHTLRNTDKLFSPTAQTPAQVNFFHVQASKEQVADMLKRMLHIPESDMLPFMDATDGLAAAYCHYLQMGRPTLTKEYSGWKDFINKNPDKIKR